MSKLQHNIISIPSRILLTTAEQYASGTKDKRADEKHQDQFFS
jgi:hypothetical protein